MKSSSDRDMRSTRDPPKSLGRQGVAGAMPTVPKEPRPSPEVQGALNRPKHNELRLEVDRRREENRAETTEVLTDISSNRPDRPMSPGPRGPPGTDQTVRETEPSKH